MLNHMIVITEIKKIKFCENVVSFAVAVQKTNKPNKQTKTTKQKQKQQNQNKSNTKNKTKTKIKRKKPFCGGIDR